MMAHGPAISRLSYVVELGQQDQVTMSTATAAGLFMPKFPGYVAPPPAAPHAFPPKTGIRSWGSTWPGGNLGQSLGGS